MRGQTSTLIVLVGLSGNAFLLSGCSKTVEKPITRHAHDGVEHEHAPGDEHSNSLASASQHNVKSLTEDDVVLPTSFEDGIARLGELLEMVKQNIHDDQLSKVHRTAEEMALVAKKMKSLAQVDVPEESRLEVGRLLNQIAGYYPLIDEVADAGKKKETEAVSRDLASAIEKLKDTKR